MLSTYKTIEEKVKYGVITGPQEDLDEISEIYNSGINAKTAIASMEEITAIASSHMGEDHNASLINTLRKMKSMKKSEMLTEIDHIIEVLDERDLMAVYALESMHEIKNSLDRILN